MSEAAASAAQCPDLPLIEKYRPQRLRDVLFDEELKQRILAAPGGCFVFAGRPGLGKCFGRHTPFRLHGGGVVYAQDVRPGDLLVSPAGRPVEVRSVVRGRAPLFRVSIPALRRSFVVNAGHLMSLQCPATGRVETFPLETAPRDWLLYSGGPSPLGPAAGRGRATFRYEVRPEGEGEYYGLEVDGHLFQLQCGVVVHNTTTALCLAHELGGEVLELNAADSQERDRPRRLLADFCRARSSRRKVVVVDEAQHLAAKAQALIVQLAERHPSATFLLTCNSLQVLHPDLVGRCTVIDFDAVGRRGVERMLRRVCRAEGLRCTAEGIAAVVRHCGGDVRQSLNVVEALGFGMGEVTEETLQEFTQNKRLLGLVDEWMWCEDDAAALQQLERAAELGFGNRDFFNHVAQWVRAPDRPERWRAAALAALHEVLPLVDEEDSLDLLLLTRFRAETRRSMGCA